MGIFNLFRKKKEFEIPSEPLPMRENKPFSEPSFENDLGTGFRDPIMPGPAVRPVESHTDINMKLVLAKLDLISQRLENMDKRLQEIERLAKE